MPLYKIIKENGVDKDLAEVESIPFEERYSEDKLEDWLELCPRILAQHEDGLLIIGRQKSQAEFGVPDLLAVNREGDLVIIENKRSEAPDETIAQLLRYLTWGDKQSYEDLNEIANDYFQSKGLSYSSLQEAHFDALLKGTGEPLLKVKFNKEQKGIIVAQEITPLIEEEARYLQKHGIEVQCHEFNYYYRGEEELLEHEIKVGKFAAEEGYLDYEECRDHIKQEGAKSAFVEFVRFVRQFERVSSKFEELKSTGFGFDLKRKPWIRGYTAGRHFRVYIRGQYREAELKELERTFPDLYRLHPEWAAAPYDYGEIGVNVQDEGQLGKLKELIKEAVDGK